MARVRDEEEGRVMREIMMTGEMARAGGRYVRERERESSTIEIVK